MLRTTNSTMEILRTLAEEQLYQQKHYTNRNFCSRTVNMASIQMWVLTYYLLNFKGWTITLKFKIKQSL